MCRTPIYDKSYIYAFKDASTRTKCVLKLLDHAAVHNVEFSFVKGKALLDAIMNNKKEFFQLETKADDKKKLSDKEVFDVLTETKAASFAFSLESKNGRDVFMYYTENDTDQKLVIETCSDLASKYLEKVISSL